MALRGKAKVFGNKGDWIVRIFQKICRMAAPLLHDILLDRHTLCL